MSDSHAATRTLTDDPISGLAPRRARGPFGSDTAQHDRSHALNVIQLRLGIGLGTVLHLTFFAFDYSIAQTVYQGVDPWPCLWLRLTALPIALTALYRMGKPPLPSERLVSWVDLFTFVGAAITLGLIGARFGGIEGPYTPGVLLVLICRGAFRTQHYREAVGPVALVIAAHFATLMLASADAHSHAWNERTLTLYALHFASLSGGAAMICAASHRAWVLRNRVFSARMLGPYRLESSLGEGGHAEVWKAHDVRTGIAVAVKVLKGDRAFDEASRVRFQREARALAMLSSPHTVRILDNGVSEDGLCYLVMELLEGETAAHLVSRLGPLSGARALALFSQLSGALAEAHAQGIVHRDIKPENLFVVYPGTEDEQLRLLDFGIARGEQTEGPDLTRTGGVIGTPAFMAPEVLRGAAATARSDVYSMGAVLRFLLGGAPLDHAEQACETDARVIIQRCMAHAPRERFADAGEVLASLSPSLKRA